MSDTRSFREVEKKLHEELYNNLCLLKYEYDTSPEFDRTFKKDVLVKNNRAAFYEVVYYLLNILNPKLTQEKLTNWPPFELKRENKFRIELLKYINELNKLYKYANIPTMMSSNLISPGGFKCARFVLKLSQLVVFEHFQKQSNELLYSPESSKDLDVRRMIDVLEKSTLDIEYKSSEKLTKFDENLGSLRQKANSHVDTLTQLDKNISASKKEQTVAEEEFYKKYTVYPSMDSLRQKLMTLKEQWECLSHIHSAFENCKQLLDYINSNNLVINPFNDRGKIAANVTLQDQLELAEFFNKLISLINRQSLELPNPSSDFIQQNSEKILHLIEKYEQMQKDILVSKQKTRLLIKDMLESLKLVEQIIESEPKVGNEVDYLADMEGIKLLESP